MKDKGSSTRELQAATLKKASRVGMAWDTNEVAVIVRGIEKDETSYAIALRLGRTYYSVQNTRRTVGFAMRHASAIWGKE